MQATPIPVAPLSPPAAHAATGRYDGLVVGGGVDGAGIAGAFEAELNYLHAHEWARTADDVLWRRTKLGLHLSAGERLAVAAWCSARWQPAAVSAGLGAVPIEETAWN